MPSQKQWNKRPTEAFAEHKFVHFHNISYDCSKQGFAQLLSNQGYDKCIIYWPNEQHVGQPSHRGFCQVQFPDAAIAARAKTAFSGYTIAGRKMKTGDATPPAPSQSRVARRAARLEAVQRSAPVATMAPSAAMAPVTSPAPMFTSALAIRSAPAFIEDSGGKKVLRSTSLPSPAPKNDALVRPWIWVQHGENSSRVFELIPLASLPLYEAAEKDQRKPVNRQETLTMDAPQSLEFVSDARDAPAGGQKDHSQC
ncbi:hypothetical protein FGRMN_5050 [Fusarium graminum]|nr:hypothetical protein FGRMN_5050 [Fusarium graminum]